MKWQNIASRYRDYAHRLRKALAGALELHASKRWGRDEIERAGLRDYKLVFGHEIKACTFWRNFDRTIERAGESKDYSNLELYLPEVIKRKPLPSEFERLASELPELQQAVCSVDEAGTPTDEEKQLIWLAACNEWKNLIDAGAKNVAAQKVIVEALNASGVALGRTGDAMRKSFKRKLTRWIEGGYSIEALRDLRAENSGKKQDLPLSEGDRSLLIAESLQGGLSRAWRNSINAGRLSYGLTQHFVSNPASKSYVPKRVRELLGPEVKMLDDLHHGPRQAKLKGAWTERDWSKVSPGDWYSADDTTLPLYYWQEDELGRPRMMRGQCLVMIDCRTGRVLAFALHSEQNYNASVIRGLILKTHDTYGLPRKGFYFERGTWKSARLIKGKGDEVPDDETEVGLRSWVEFIHAKAGNARAKTVERIIGLLQNNMEDQPGYCGRNEQVEKFEKLCKTKLDHAAGRIHPGDFVLHRDEWVARLSDICDAYNNERQDGKMIKGLSPREAWESLFDYSQPLVKLTPETRFLLSSHRRPLKVTKNGLCVQIGKVRTWFRNQETGRLIGRIVQVYFDPEDMSSIFIKMADSDAHAIVVPAAPIIPALGASREEFDEANASIKAHSSYARTLYRSIEPHFSKNAPSPFRAVLADRSTVDQGRDIAEEQNAIRERNDSDESQRRTIAKQQRRLGVKAPAAVSNERKIAGLSLLTEAEQHADS
jgi:hypothetical protein